MPDDPLISRSKLEGSDPLFTTCGRALYVAQHFERNLRGVAAALDIRAACIGGELSPSDEKKLSKAYGEKLERRLCESISPGLSGHIPEALKQEFEAYMLPLFDRARKARNRIAHDSLFGIEGLQIPSDAFDQIVNSFRKDVEILAGADFSVCNIIQVFNKEPVPCCRKSYVDDIIKWVFEPINELLTKGQPPAANLQPGVVTR
ncbi:MAG: hypothetical protein PHP98_09930 [Kiritimatiellae bacterium]|nr:hypothetical protein [Kiritimatiellia bacterium]